MAPDTALEVHSDAPAGPDGRWTDRRAGRIVRTTGPGTVARPPAVQESAMRVIRSHPLLAFFVLAFVVAWAFVPFGSFGAFGPLVAALVVVPLSRGRDGLRELGRRVVRWRVRWFWWVLALALPLAVHLIAVLVSGPSAGPPVTAASVGTVVLLFLLRLVDPLDGPLGEEPGWRGVALPGLLARSSPLAATAVLAVVITVWHVPLAFLGGSDPWTDLVLIVVGTIAVTFWYTWLFAHTGGSVLLCLVAHGAEGALQNDTLVYVGVWLVVAVLLVVVDRRWWIVATSSLTRAQPT